MSYLFPLGIAIAFIGLFFMLIFSFTTMRRLRKNPHRSSDFEAQDLFSGADIGAAMAAASMPKWWRDYKESRGEPILREKHEWIMANTCLWERVLARIVFALLNSGIFLVVLGLIGKAIWN